MKITKPNVICLLTLLLAFVVSSQANAQRFKLPFGKKTAEAKQQSIYLDQKDGPWLIMCASFVGEDGRQDAIRLAQDLRQNHKLNAFVYSHHFNLEEKTAGLGMGYEKNPISPMSKNYKPRKIRMKAASSSNFDEIAVLVGNFPSVDDARAQRTLAHIKQLMPRSMANYDPELALEDSAVAKSRAWRDKSIKKMGKSEGPMRAAFMLPNPLLPDEYFAARKIDDFVLKLNKGVKFSLLDNKEKYSVKVATFSGDTTLELDEIAQTKAKDAWLRKNRKAVTDSKLANAAKKATILVTYLRQKGIEAYVFHDRYESYVCVGGFDWIVETDARGNKRNNPAVVKTILEFKGSSMKIADRPGAVTTYKLPTKLAHAGIACDVQPVPVLVRKDDNRLKTNKLFGYRR